MRKDVLYEDVELKPKEYIYRKKVPFQVDQRKLDRVFKDKEEGFRYNKGPYYNLRRHKDNQF